MTLRIGFVGCGLIARIHGRRLLADENAAIVSVFDVDDERMRAFAADHGAEEAASVVDVIDRSDAVYVTTWTSEHPAVVEAVVAAGKPVFCEKPLGVDLATAEAMVATVERSGVINQVGLVLRGSPAFRWLRHNVSSGDSGPVMSLIFRDDQYIPVQGMYGSTWRGDPALAGSGALLEHSIHDLDLIEWTMGPIESISCVTANVHGIEGIEDQATLLLRAESGGHALLSSTWHDITTRPSMRRVEVFCLGGYFGLEGDWLGPIVSETSAGGSQRWEGDEVAAMAHDLDGGSANPDADFVASVLADRPASPDFRAALRAHILADAAYRSAAQDGTPIGPIGV